jgi:hypothetical protein
VAYVVDDEQQAHLGRILIALYQPVVEEALPDTFRNLLDALDRRGVTSGPSPEGSLLLEGRGSRSRRA